MDMKRQLHPSRGKCVFMNLKVLWSEDMACHSFSVAQVIGRQ